MEIELTAGANTAAAEDGTALMNLVQDLIAYAKTESPDPYEVIARARAINEKWCQGSPFRQQSGS